jgi:hypothetical protein
VLGPTERRGRAGCAAAAAAALVVSWAPLAAAVPAVTLAAAADAGGLVKAGRWAPLTVTIESNEETFEGDLLVSWGDTRLRRRLSLASRGRRELDLHIRTSNPESTIHLRLVAGGVEVRRISVPVRILEQAEEATLCVTPPDGGVTDAACTATITPERLPRSMRGYEAVERLVLPDFPLRLSTAQRVALERWRSIRPLEQSGDLALAPYPSPPTAMRGLPRPTALFIAGVSAAFVLCAAGSAVMGRRRRRPVARVLTAVGVALFVSSVAASAVGSLGPRAVVVQHESLVQQAPGSPGSLLVMRGLATFPASGRYTLQFHVRDGSVEPAGHAVEMSVDESGLPVLTGGFGLGGRQAFSVDAVADLEALAVTRQGRTWTVTNRSGVELSDCRFSEGFSKADLGNLAPGSSMTAEEAGEGIGPALTCVTDAALVNVTAGDRDVRLEGRTHIALYRND